MRKVLPVLLVPVLWFCLGAGPVLADGMVLPLPEGLGSEYLAVRYHHVSVHIEDGHAVTRVEQEFYNPHDVPVQGRYLFPVPPDAILSRFRAEVEGSEQQVVRQDAEATNAALYNVVTRQRDPSLLRYADWESLAFDLALAPGDSRRVSLEYEEILAPSGGLYRYRYVLSTERYSVLPLEEVSITVDVRSSSGLSSLYSSSHEVTTERQGQDRAQVRWAAQQVNPGEDFELYFAPSWDDPAAGGFGGGLLTGERNGQGHLLFLFSPQSDPGRVSTLPKDLVFVIDRSGSMGGEKIEQARNALHYILGQLGEGDRFSIVDFDHRISAWERTLQPVDERTLDGARRYVTRLWADGNTNLETALQTGLEILDRSKSRGATRMVVFLTDGLPTAGVTEESLITHLVTEANAPLEARLHVFGVGYDVNTHLLDGLAAGNGGTVTYVRPGEDLELALTGFYGKIADPLLTDVEVEFEGLEVTDLYPEAIPDLFRGSSLLLAGRYQAGGDAVTVRVRGWAGDVQREYVYHLNLAETGGRDFVPRLWATRRVGALLDRVRVEGEREDLVDEIRGLGLDYGIVTPYTTFVLQGQADGAASAANMALYDLAELNRASGRVAVEARVQNQAYQEAVQADLAQGANVTNYGRQSLAQVGGQQVDLSLLRDHKGSEGAISGVWIERNIEVDRFVEFGSDEYLALAADPEARSYLQSGSNVVFAYQGQIIAVRDPDFQPPDPAAGGLEQDVRLRGSALLSGRPDLVSQGLRSAGLVSGASPRLLGVLLLAAGLGVVALLFGGLALVLAIRHAARPR